MTPSAKRILKKSLIISVCTLILLLLTSAGVTMYLLTTVAGQQKAKEFVVGMLAKEIQIEIRLDSISINVRNGNIDLFGFAIKDLQGIEMLSVESVEVGINFRRLFSKEIALHKAVITGANGVFYKAHPDSAANFQFALDRLKSKRKAKVQAKKEFKFIPNLERAEIIHSSLKWDVATGDTVATGTFSPDHMHIKDFGTKIKISLQDTVVTYAEISEMKIREENSGVEITLGSLAYDATATDSTQLRLSRLSGKLLTNVVGIQGLDLRASTEDFKRLKNLDVKLTNLAIHTNNSPHRINFNRPHHGAFDAKHLNLGASAAITIKSIRHDSIDAKLRHMEFLDTGSQLKITNLSCDIAHHKEATKVTNFSVSMENTTVTIPECNIQHKGSDIIFGETKVTGKTLLKDIHKPFAPILRTFTTPLALRVTAGGPIDKLKFRDIVVNTLDNRLKITAEGLFTDITKKKEMVIRFFNIFMTTRNGVKDQIIGHFAQTANLNMKPQMKAIGDIDYKGTLAVKFKREEFQGTVFSKHANLNFTFAINEWNKIMQGSVWTDSCALGAIMNIKSLSIGHTKADFRIIASQNNPQTIAAKKRGGQLPIGTLSAKVEKTRYGIIKVKEIDANITSDGVVASGTAIMPNNLVDLSMDFDYKQTDKEQTLKTKPHAKFHFNFLKKDKGKDNSKDASNDISKATSTTTKQAKK